MKKLLLNTLGVITAVLMAIQGFAASVSWSPTTANTNSILATGSSIFKITVANPSAAVATVTFRDAPATSQTYVIGAYSNQVLTVTSYTNVFTNILGTVQTTIYTNILRSTLTAVAQTTNDYPIILSLVIPAGTTYNFEPVNPHLAFQGILGVTTTNVTATIEYAPIF